MQQYIIILKMINPKYFTLIVELLLQPLRIIIERDLQAYLFIYYHYATMKLQRKLTFNGMDTIILHNQNHGVVLHISISEPEWLILVMVCPLHYVNDIICRFC